MFCKKIIKAMLPYGIVRLLEKTCHNSTWGYIGSYESMSLAKKYASGYNAENIIQKVQSATLQVIDGKACYERDSVLFYKKQHHHFLVSCLYRIAMENNGELHVLDFGGALGSSFWQNREILQNVVKHFSWHIVEQENFYKASQTLSYDAPLFFHKTIQEALNAEKRINVVLLSSVLQYVDEPEKILAQIENIDYVIIDRHPEFLELEQAVFSVQYVKEPIYNASYALKIWGKDELKKILLKKYSLLDEWTSTLDGIQLLELKKGCVAQIHDCGMFLRKNKFRD